MTRKKETKKYYSLFIFIGSLALTCTIMLAVLWGTFYFHHTLSCGQPVINLTYEEQLPCPTGWTIVPLWITVFVFFSIPFVVFIGLVNGAIEVS